MSSNKLNIKDVIRREGANKSNTHDSDSTSRETHIKIPRFTEGGERIYALSVGDIAKYCNMKRQNVTHYCRNNPSVFYRVERLGQKDARILGIPCTEAENKMRTYLVYATKRQMEDIKPFSKRQRK